MSARTVHHRGTILVFLALAAACTGVEGPRTGARLVLAPPWTSIPVGDPLIGDTVRAAFVTEEGVQLPATAVAWTSSDTAVARIDATGLIRAVRVGVTTIRGTAEDDIADQLIAITDPRAGRHRRHRYLPVHQRRSHGCAAR